MKGSNGAGEDPGYSLPLPIPYIIIDPLLCLILARKARNTCKKSLVWVKCFYMLSPNV